MHNYGTKHEWSYTNIGAFQAMCQKCGFPVRPDFDFKYIDDQLTFSDLMNDYERAQKVFAILPDYDQRLFITAGINEATAVNGTKDMISGNPDYVYVTRYLWIGNEKVPYNFVVCINEDEECSSQR